MTKNTSRQRILVYLSQHNGATAAEISISLGVTEANIRHHLAILVSDGRVKTPGTRPEFRRGRPEKIFSLGENKQKESLGKLAGILLNHMLEYSNGSDTEKILKQLANELVPVREQQRGLITSRLAQTVALLSEQGYAARWEAHSAAPRILFEDCPYATIIASHPELCQMDRIILEQHLDGQIEQTAKLEKSARGTSFCRFVLKNSQP